MILFYLSSIIFFVFLGVTCKKIFKVRTTIRTIQKAGLSCNPKRHIIVRVIRHIIAPTSKIQHDGLRLYHLATLGLCPHFVTLFPLQSLPETIRLAHDE